MIHFIWRIIHHSLSIVIT